MSNNTLLNVVRPNRFYSEIQPVEIMNENIHINIENVPNQPPSYFKIILSNIFDCLPKVKKILSEQCLYIGMGILLLFIIFILLLVIYLIYIGLGLLYICFAISFENTIVYIFGRGTYNKYYPVCTNTVYTGNNCYTTSSTYCS